MHFSTLNLTPSTLLAITLFLNATTAHPAALPYPHSTSSILSIYASSSVLNTRDQSSGPLNSNDQSQDHTLVPTTNPKTPRYLSVDTKRDHQVIQITQRTPQHPSRSPKDHREIRRHVSHDSQSSHPRETRPASYLPTFIKPRLQTSLSLPPSSRLRLFNLPKIAQHHSQEAQIPMQPIIGTIKMGSSMNHHIALPFSMSGESCAPLASDCGCLVEDLQAKVLDAYPSGVAFQQTKHCASPSAFISETVRVALHGREYRATLLLTLKSQDAGVDGVPRNEFRAIVGLLGKTATALWKDVAKVEKGFGMLVVEASLEGVGVDAKWVFYEVQKGEAVKCI